MWIVIDMATGKKLHFVTNDVELARAWVKKQRSPFSYKIVEKDPDFMTCCPRACEYALECRE